MTPAKRRAPSASIPGAELRAGVWVVPDARLTETVPRTELMSLTALYPAREYGPGARIYRAGDAADGLYLVLTGRVKLSALGATGERVLAVCGPGELFGTTACGGVAEHRSEAVSLADATQVVSLTCAQLKDVAGRVPAVGLAVTRALAERVQALEEGLEVAGLPVQGRLAHALLSLTGRFGVEVAPGVWELDLELRHDELASLAGTTRQRATQALSAWRSMELVVGTRGRYQVSRTGLQALLELLEQERA